MKSRNLLSALLGTFFAGGQHAFNNLMNSAPSIYGTGALRATRSPQLVAELKASAAAKRARKARKLAADAFQRDINYYNAVTGVGDGWNHHYRFHMAGSV